MKHALLLAPLICCLHLNIWAQEIRAKISINTSRLGNVEQAMFDETARQIADLINNTAWTQLTFSPAERIESDWAINLTEQEGDDKYKAELSLTAHRPVFDASYTSPLIVWRDKEVSFRLQPYETLLYSPNQIDNELVATIVFYVYFLITLDNDSFAELGGNVTRDNLQQLAREAAQAFPQSSGWQAHQSDYNRYAIADALADPAQEPFRKMWYLYHRRGLDELVANVQRGRTNMLTALPLLEETWQARSRSPLLILFSQTKLKELVQVAEKASDQEKTAAYKLLYKLYPTEGNVLDELK